MMDPACNNIEADKEGLLVDKGKVLWPIYRSCYLETVIPVVFKVRQLLFPESPTIVNVAAVVPFIV